jgi:mRNA interferase MazF
MSRPSPGDLVTVAFPFDDLSGTKRRPALCLTHPFGTHGHVVVAFITSRPPAEVGEGDLKIGLEHEGTGLRVDSWLRLHRLTTLRESVIPSRLGRLPALLREDVRGRLRRLLDL